MSERKPMMAPARRKVLNLLEFCTEMDPDCCSIHELLRGLVGGDNLVTARDWSDEELAEVLSQYASRLVSKRIEVWNDEG
jgi:hypothetical protein